MVTDMKDLNIWAYRRENGSLGVRNYVLLLPLDAVSSQICRGVNSLINGTKTFYHPYGRMQFGKDLELHFRTLIGTGCNPNVAAVIVVGIEPEWTKVITDGIANTGKPVTGFSSSGNGDLRTIEMAARKAMEFVRYATGLRREEARLSQLTIGLKCGESDTTSGFASNPAVGVVTERLTSSGATIMFGETPELTGAEQVLVNSFEKDELRTEFMKVYKSYFDFILSQGVDLLGSQPNKGNIAGGISTIEEKAMGNIQKIGRAKIHGILDTAEVPREPCLYFMNTSSAAADLLTAMAAAGAAVQLFTTGKGNNVGTAISPVIKICANRETCENSAENIDVDISGIIYGGSSLSSGADAIMECMARVCSGEYTSTEMLFHEEFAPTRLFPQS